MVAVNYFDGAPVYTVEEVRDALDLDDHIPVLLGDARNRQSCKNNPADAGPASHRTGQRK